jgi:uncharacterized damage-inducible protein DinB
MSMLGLLKHLASVEYGWFCHTFGRETEPLPFDLDDEGADFHIHESDTADAVVAFFKRARAAANVVIDELDVEATGIAWFGETVTMRWVLIHMIEEVARHAGHLDLMRESIDGATGHHDRT